MGARPESGFVRRSRPQFFCTDYTRLVYGGISCNQSESPLASAVVSAVLMTAMLGVETSRFEDEPPKTKKLDGPIRMQRI